jgi:hypothetical protein
VKNGTFRADRQGVAVLAVVPEVSADGWELAPKLVLDRIMSAGADWLAGTDEIALAMLREALELHERSKISGSIRDQIAAQQNVTVMLSALGFEPTARARLGLAKVATVSKLEALRQKHETK